MLNVLRIDGHLRREIPLGDGKEVTHEAGDPREQRERALPLGRQLIAGPVAQIPESARTCGEEGSDQQRQTPAVIVTARDGQGAPSTWRERELLLIAAPQP